ncbi:MAG: flagellar basal-body rod protein FlgB [Firmicutes bacterium]|nr:flagellar basal-body rod protein FlgB [Bacillota bacterium]
MSGWLDNPVLTVLEKGLNASSLRQKVLADNVANVDTPGFKRSDVNFQLALNAALGTRGSELSLKTTVPKHISSGEAENQSIVQTDHSTSMRNDSNNVDIDREMANVAENGLYYNALTKTISSQLGILRMVIK